MTGQSANTLPVSVRKYLTPSQDALWREYASMTQEAGHAWHEKSARSGFRFRDLVCMVVEGECRYAKCPVPDLPFELPTRNSEYGFSPYSGLRLMNTAREVRIQEAVADLIQSWITEDASTWHWLNCLFALYERGYIDLAERLVGQVAIAFHTDQAIAGDRLRWLTGYLDHDPGLFSHVTLMLRLHGADLGEKSLAYIMQPYLQSSARFRLHTSEALQVCDELDWDFLGITERSKQPLTGALAWLEILPEEAMIKVVTRIRREHPFVVTSQDADRYAVQIGRLIDVLRRAGDVHVATANDLEHQLEAQHQRKIAYEGESQEQEANYRTHNRELDAIIARMKA